MNLDINTTVLKEGITDYGGALIQSYVETQPLGVFLLDACYGVIYKNSCALRILSANDGVAMIRDSLLINKCKDLIPLSRFLGDDQFISGSVVKQISRPSGKRAYLMQMVSLPAFPLRKMQTHEQITRILCLCDPEEPSDISKQHLKDFYGLTSREACLAKLIIDGCTVEGIATRLKVTKNTVRFHLRSIFRKTETSGQVELVRLLLAAPRLNPIHLDGF
jgi:DNA-binding CsgD family transcriptional regulator